MEERIIKKINALLTQLFSKMHEAGYEWDAEKKELRKIEQKPAWSEEDKEMHKKVETAIDSYYAPFSTDAEKMSNWLKNLKDRVQPQNTWKPSDEQLTCLEDAVKAYHRDGYPAIHLTSLLKELKAL